MNNLPCIRIDNDQIMKELIVIQRCIWPIITKTMVTLKRDHTYQRLLLHFTMREQKLIDHN